MPLLLASEEPATLIENEDGQQPWVLICEHAGRQFPEALGTLGLNTSQTNSHIAWDIGAAAVAKQLARLLDAPLILQRYSRLVYDCNRPEGAASATPASSASIDIPGNKALCSSDRKARFDEIYLPFERAIARIIERGIERGQQPVIVSIHSFTRLFNGQLRHLDLGVLHDADPTLADAILSLAQQDDRYISLRNAPYGPQDGVTHTLKLHGVKRGLANVMLEIRNDLIADNDGQTLWSNRLATLLNQAIK